MLVRKPINLVMWRSLLAASVLVSLNAMPAHAIEFRTVAANKSVVYDAPSTEANKLYIFGSGYPVEVIVNLGEWIKVRDHFGSLSWIQNKQLTNKRSVLVLQDNTPLKQSEDANAALVTTLAKDVVVELLTPVAKNGWVKVKHRDGLTGFVQATALWGF